MIKRFRFAARSSAGPSGSWWESWLQAAGGLGSAPDGTRPIRMAVCPVLVDETPDAPHAGVGIEWFRDADHAARFLAWAATEEGRSAEARLAAVVDLTASPALLALESVMRGQDWLERRWGTGGSKLKHMALARRAVGLTPDEFSARWRSRAGTVGTAGGRAVPIPDRARGCAYIQNHPLAGRTGAPFYDAVNEVYFEDLEGLRYRMEWFANRPPGQAEDDLIERSWFLAVRELIPPPLQ